MTLRSIPLWIRDHLSFRRSDSISLSSCDMSGLILISLESDLALDKSSDTSMVRVSLTSIGRGFVDWSRYFPSLSTSRIAVERFILCSDFAGSKVIFSETILITLISL